MMIRWQWFAQGFCYSLAILFIGHFSNSPVYSPLSDEEAVIILTLRHSGKLLGECRLRSEEELAKLPPNMRIAEICPRERSPLRLELSLNGEPHYGEWLAPAGWQKDGTASLYKRFTVPAGETDIDVRMKDHEKAESFEYLLHRRVRLAPGHVLVIDFNAPKQAFVIL